VSAQSSRRAIEDEIERLILLLDTIDGDPDLEGGGDLEPDEDAGCEDYSFDDYEPGPWNPNGCHIAGGGSGI